MKNRQFLPRPIAPHPEGPRAWLVVCLVLTLVGFIAIDAHSQATGSGGFVVMRAYDGTNIINVGDNANTAIRVNVVAGAAGGVTHVDDAAFTVAVDDGVPLFGLADETTPDSVDENDAGAVRMSLNRNLYVRLRDNAGNERGLEITAGGEAEVTLTTALPAGTANIGDVDIASAIPAGTNNIGDVDVLTFPSVATANNDGAQVSVAATSTAVLASFSTRKMAIVCSKPTNTAIVHIKLGATAATTDGELQIGQCLTIGPAPYTGAIDGISASGTQTVTVWEW